MYPNARIVLGFAGKVTNVRSVIWEVENWLINPDDQAAKNAIPSTTMIQKAVFMTPALFLNRDRGRGQNARPAVYHASRQLTQSWLPSPVQSVA